MNTTEKGDLFEDIAYRLIEKMIEEDKLGIVKKYARLFRKKGYYSDERKGDITFDISIELWLPGADRYSMLFLIECKNFKTPISVHQIERFSDQISQIAVHNVKGIIIANNNLQTGAFNIAESRGLMLIKAQSERNYEVLLHRSNISDELQTQIAFFDNNTISVQFAKEVEKLVKNCFARKSSTSNFNIPDLGKEDIEILAEEELNRIQPLVLKDGFVLEPKHLISYLKEEYKLKINRLPQQSSLLGAFDRQNSEILINPRIEKTKQYYFVLAHEFAHFILHQDLEIDQETYDSYDDPEYSFRTNKYELTNAKHWIEWQANCFASSLILHRYPLMKVLLKLNNYSGQVNITDHFSHINHYNKLVSQLSYFFSVSDNSISYRLNALGIVRDYSRLRSVGRIIDANYNGLFI